MEKIAASKSNVRLVKCPRCARLLAEPSDVLLYGCGGCGTLLQAKHYKKERERRKSSDCSSYAQTDESENNTHGGVVKGETNSSSANLISCPQHSQEQNEGIDQNFAQFGKVVQLRVSSSSEEVSSSNQPQPQPQSAFSSQDTNEASFSNGVARLTLEDPSSIMEQDEMVVEEQFEVTDSSSQATTTLNEAEISISQDSKSEKYYKGHNKHYLTIQRRTPSMLNVIEMPSQHTRLGSKGRAQHSYLYEPSGFSTSLMDDDFYTHQNQNHLQTTYMDGRMFPTTFRVREELPMHPCYNSSQEIYPHVFSESEYSEDQEISKFRLRRKSQNLRRIRPMAGAAPFITCYKCLELLELPLESLPFKTRRRSYMMKCSTCSSNLEFAVVDENGSRRRQLVPKIKETVGVRDKGKSKTVENQSHEEVKRSGLSLHRLMGYATPSAMLDGHD